MTTKWMGDEPKLTFISCSHRKGEDDLRSEDMMVTLDDSAGVILQLCPTCAAVVKARILTDLLWPAINNEIGRSVRELREKSRSASAG